MSLSFRSNKKNNSRGLLLTLLPAIGGLVVGGAAVFVLKSPSQPPAAVAPVQQGAPVATSAAPAPATTTAAAPAATPAPAPTAAAPKAAPVAAAQPVQGTVPIPERFKGKVFNGTLLGSKDKVVALTFDDGPWEPTTPQVLEILKQENIKATFFLIGRFVETYPGLVQDVADAGHVLASHSWSHTYNKKSEKEVLHEIDDTAAIIKRASGVQVNLFRPPGDKMKIGTADYAMKRGYAIIRWTVVSGDDVPSTKADKMVNNVLSKVQPGAVILMHDGGGRRPTVEALPKIIAGLREKGYRFVTIPELLEMQKI